MSRRTIVSLTALTAVVVLVTACGSDVPPSVYFSAQAQGNLAGQAALGLGAPASEGRPGDNSAALPGQPTPGITAASLPGATTGGGLPPGAPGQPTASRPTGSTPIGASAGSCAGFSNQKGVSSSTITIANASDLTGPIAGIFQSARQAVQAYVDYFNSVSSICGRHLSLESLDSQTSDTGDEQAATTACGNAFAMVGSMSAFDDGGAQTVTSCGIPDLRAITVNPPRADSPVVFAADGLSIPEVPTAPYEYYKSVNPGATQHAAMLYLNVGATTTNGKSFQKAAEQIGYKFVYSQSVSVTEFNYAPYVAAMQSAGVQLVQWVGNYQNAVTLKKATDQQNFHPMFIMDSVAYDPGFYQDGGSAVNGTYSYIDTAMFEEASRNPAMQLYLHWLHVASPSATPSFFGVFAWGAAELFAQEALELGGKLTRATLLSALKNVKGYTANGLFAPQAVGAKTTSPCQTVMQLENGTWVRRTPYPYTCGSLVNSGIGK